MARGFVIHRAIMARLLGASQEISGGDRTISPIAAVGNVHQQNGRDFGEKGRVQIGYAK
jgi:hypothetical protein